MLFSEDYFKFTRVTGGTGYGTGVLLSETGGAPSGNRHTYWGKDLAVGATTVTYQDSVAPTGDPLSYAWERSYGGTVPSSATLVDYFRDYYAGEIKGKTVPGLNLHNAQIDPGSHLLERDNHVIGQVDVYDYPYGTRTLSVEHWWLTDSAGAPVLQRTGHNLVLTASGATTGAADAPDAPADWYQLIVVVLV